MTRSPRLLVAITAHGYGHVAQTAPILNELAQRYPKLQLSIVSAIPEIYLQRRIHARFDYHHLALDIGMLMESAVAVRVEESAAAYREFHSHLNQHVAAVNKVIERTRPKLIFANAPYTPFIAAAQHDIPAIGLCSLNWADIYHHYCSHCPEASDIHQQIVAAYRQASRFLKPAPSMPMASFPSETIAPITNIGRNVRTELNRELGIDPGRKLVVVGLGGINTAFDMRHWQVGDACHWLIPESWQNPSAHMSCVEACQHPFIDLLASADLLVTKPGYGSFSEAACNRVPALYLERDGWPESIYLEQWLQQHGLCRKLTLEQFSYGDFVTEIEALLTTPHPIPPSADGVRQTVEILQSYL